jgi:N-methylhydantoinase A
VEILTWRLKCQGPVTEAPLESWAPPSAYTAQDARVGTRAIHLPHLRAFADAPVYDRYRLSAGVEFTGPAIVEERESTVVINGPARVRVDGHANLLVDLNEV